MAVEEILVHVSSSQSDVQARRLATAYDSFVASTWTSFHSGRLPSSASGNEASAECVDTSKDRHLQADYPSDCLEDTGLAVANLQSGILTSSLHIPVATPESDALSQPVSRVQLRGALPQAFNAAPLMPPVPSSSPRLIETPDRLQHERDQAGQLASSLPLHGSRGTTDRHRSRMQRNSVVGEHDSQHILPPRAPIAMLPPSVSHVTPELAQLAQSLPLQKYYEPLIHKTREINHLERGYWAIDTQTWSPALQDKLWSFMIDFVSNGQAGWTVTCWREAVSSSIESERSSALALSRGNFVKVYCFGELVPYVYLLLYTGSESRVKRLGAEWIDAGGQAVIRTQNFEPSR